MSDPKYIPTPQAVLNHALKELSKALDAVEKNQQLILERLKDASPMPEIERYMRYGSRAPRRKNDNFGEVGFEEGVKQVEN